MTSRPLTDRREPAVLLLTLGCLVRVQPDDTLTSDELRDIEHGWSRTLVADTGDDAPVLTIGLSSPSSSAEITASDLDELKTALTQRVTLTAIEQRRGDLLMLHAAGLADPATGRTVALVAPSETGKTTAARTLGRALGYVSDETVGITSDHRVVPHAKPLSIRPEAPGRSSQVCPDDLDLLAPPDELTIAALAVLVRDPAATSVSADPLPLTDLLELVVPQISYLPELPDGLLRVLDLVAHCGGGWRLSYAEAADLAPTLERLLAESAPEPSPWRRVDVGRRASAPIPGTVSVRRADSSDAVTDGVSLIIVTGRQVVELQGIAPAIWHEAAAWTSVDRLVPRLTELFGPPTGESAAALVRRAVEELVDQGVLETTWAPPATLLALDLPGAGDKP